MAAAFVVAAAFSVFFLIRTVVATVYWADPSHHEQAIEAWMPIRYVARSWDVPPEVLAEALDIDLESGRRWTVGEVAAQRQTSPEAVADALMAAIQGNRAGRK